MRLTSSFWVSAYLRRCAQHNIFGVVERKGAVEAGAVFIKVSLLDGTGLLFAPAPQSFFDEGPTQRKWVAVSKTGPLTDADIDVRIAREVKFDPDLWLVTIEDRDGRHMLEDELIAADG